MLSKNISIILYTISCLKYNCYSKPITGPVISKPKSYLKQWHKQYIKTVYNTLVTALHPVTFLMFFYSCSCQFFYLAADTCLSWSLPSMTEQHICPHRLRMQYWLKNQWPHQAVFKHSPHTNCISNSAIWHNNYISLLSDLCTCVHVKKKMVLQRKP